jgi:hypothetical protein
MRRVSWKLLLLLLPFGAFLASYEWRFASQPNNSIALKRQLIEMAAPSVDVLILGSSQAEFGVRPARVSPHAFNLAGVSQSLYYDTGLARAYLDRLPSLRVVVITLSYFSLGYELDRTVESWRTFYYARFHHVWHRDWRRNTEIRNFSTWFLYGKDSLVNNLQWALPNMAGRYDAAGGILPPGELYYKAGTPEALEANAPFTMARAHRSWRSSSLPENATRLAETIQQLQSRKGVRVVLVTLPVSAAYRALEREDIVALNRSRLEEIRRRCGVQHFNYEADERFSSSDFLDSDHLNLAGAEKISDILRREIVLDAAHASLDGAHESRTDSGHTMPDSRASIGL